MKLLAPIKNDEDIVNKKYVDSIDIGSRNIVTGTANMVIGSGKWEKGHWRQSGTGTIETIDISDSPVAGVSKGIKITASSTSQNGIAQDLIPLNSNNAYTLSCWVRGSSSAVRCRLQPYYASSTDTGGTVSLVLTGEWQYISYTTIKNPANTANYSGAYVYLIPSTAGDTLEVCGIKLERGNKATDWSPAPEDLAIDDCITDLSSSGTTVTYTKKDGSIGTITTQDTHYTTGLKVGANATATANTVATNGNVYLNILDNTTVRDSHNIVGSGSTTVTSDANGKITVNSTDTKVSISPAEEKSAKTYYPTVYESTNGASVALNSIKDCNVVVINGTEESVGYSVLRLGNDTASGTAGNKYGQLTLYSKSSGYSAIRAADTTEVVSHMLPATGGTILNTGTTSFTRSLTSGTKIGSIKINNTSIDIYAPTNTDTKVTAVENHYTPSANSSAALSASASGATAAWNIDVVKGITLSRDAKGHVTGVSVTSGKIPANPNTDTKVTQTVTTSNASYPLLLAPNGQTATATTTAYFDSGVTLNPSTNTIAANISGSSASCTGNSDTATKLTTSAGSATQPVYFSDGKPVKCTYTLGKSVPSDAVFTDTKVTNALATTTKAYITGTTTATTNTGTQVFDTGVYLDDKAGNLTATQFNGKLNGNATSATKATQDSAGQQINTTYIKDVSISGTNLSYTKGDSTVTTTTVNDILSGSALTSNNTTATTTKGYSYGVAGVTTSPYNYTKWYAYLDSGITTLTNGMIIKMRIPVAGCNYGTCIAINGSDFHPVVFNTNSVVTTHYGVGVELLLMYDSNGSAKVYSNSATSAAISGVWRVMNNYNSNTTNTAGSTNTSSKIFLVGTTSQTTYAQTYSNSKVYVGKDSCLYSNGTKVSVEGHTHISEEHSFWNGTSSHTFNYVAGRNRAYIIAWMQDGSRTYMGFNLIYAAPTVNTTSSVILTSNGTTDLSYNVTDGNITIGGGTGSCRCAVIWFTV